MKIYKPGIDKDRMRLFFSDINAREYFTYVGNMVTLEQAVAVIALLAPDFIEVEECIFWSTNADEFDREKPSIEGYKRSENRKSTKSNTRKDIERYKNNFAIGQFFSKWGEEPEQKFLMVDPGEKDLELLYIFAHQIKHHWQRALTECFPDRSFEFEIADGILDEYGVCLTFWQS